MPRSSSVLNRLKNGIWLALMIRAGVLQCQLFSARLMLGPQNSLELYDGMRG